MIKKLFKKAIKVPVRKYRKYKAKSALIPLKSHKSMEVRAVGKALLETLSDTIHNSEKEWISLIEDRRNLLLKSNEEIVMIDYGAGSPDSTRTKEEMEKGIELKVSVASISKASKPKFWAIFLFKLIRYLKPKSCVELGTCVGISASYIASALKMNGKGKITTLEGAPEIAKIAEKTIDNLGLNNTTIVLGTFNKTLLKVLEDVKPVDFFFNDGHHDHDAVLQYFNNSYKYLSDSAVIIFDDISWSSGMRKAWEKIENDERVAITIDLGLMGVAIVSKNFKEKEKFVIPF